MAEPIREGIRYIKIFFCHGCQICYNVNDDGELERSEHIVATEDVTDDIVKLKENENGTGKEPQA